MVQGPVESDELSALEQVQSIAFSRKREALAKEQGVPIHKLVLKRPEGLSRGPGARWRRKLPPVVHSHTTCSQQSFPCALLTKLWFSAMCV